ncbi:MAG: hypothetical protein V1692_02690 [bacterium]
MSRKFSRSAKKYIRSEKAIIRKSTADLAKRKLLLDELYRKVSGGAKE